MKLQSFFSDQTGRLRPVAALIANLTSRHVGSGNASLGDGFRPDCIDPSRFARNIDTLGDITGSKYADGARLHLFVCQNTQINIDFISRHKGQSGQNTSAHPDLKAVFPELIENQFAGGSIYLHGERVARRDQHGDIESPLKQAVGSFESDKSTTQDHPGFSCRYRPFWHRKRVSKANGLSQFAVLFCFPNTNSKPRVYSRTDGFLKILVIGPDP